ncbi:MAG: ankyrin repeat domain-containing protein [Pirellulaceae bacterium]
MRQHELLKTDLQVPWAWGRGNQVWAMFEAAANDEVATLQKLVATEPSLVGCEFHYRTPLRFAVLNNRLKATEWLLNQGACATVDYYGQHLPMEARERGFTDVADLLDVRLHEKWQIEPAAGEAIGMAFRERDVERTRQLIDQHGSEVADRRGNKPIHWAVITRQQEFVQALLDAGADINALRPDGARPLDLTNGDYWYRGWRDLHPDAPSDHWALMSWLIDQGAFYDLTTAARRNDLNRAREILAADPQAATRDAHYITWYSGYPLRSACKAGHLEFAQLLLQHGADPNHPEHFLAPWGGSLYDSTQNRHYDVVRWLLENGANPNQEVESSGNCLYIASGDDQLTALIREHGGRLDMYQCVDQGSVDGLQQLLEEDPYLAKEEDSFLEVVEKSNDAQIDLFLKYEPGLWQRVPATLPVLARNMGTDVNATNWLNVHQIHHGCNADELEKWVSAGVQLNLVDSEYRSTPLGWAARSGNMDYARLLLQAGADPNAAGADWATPLAWAERRGHVEIAKILHEFDVKK